MTAYENLYKNTAIQQLNIILTQITCVSAVMAHLTPGQGETPLP